MKISRSTYINVAIVLPNGTFVNKIHRGINWTVEYSCEIE